MNDSLANEWGDSSTIRSEYVGRSKQGRASRFYVSKGSKNQTGNNCDHLRVAREKHCFYRVRKLVI